VSAKNGKFINARIRFQYLSGANQALADPVGSLDPA